MEDDNLQKPYKQRFKGVENFLRRIAFNLGNTPSQTEVKIISCIPIDVTDLQQKIINLEKQLYEAQQAEVHSIDPTPLDNDQDKQNTNNHDKLDNEEKPRPSTVVNTAFVRRTSAVSYSSKKPVASSRTHQESAYCGDCSSRQRKSNVSFVFPAISAPVEQGCGSRDNYNDRDDNEFERKLGNDMYKSIFRRRKKKKAIGGKSKIKTQLIYYAQESPKNPFHLNNKSLTRKENINNEKGVWSQSYLNSIVRRQYDPKFTLEEFSDTSHFSKPICRDVEDNQKHPCNYESDVCSCCHGRFHNLDNIMMNNLKVDAIIPCAYKQKERDKTYYDSNIYDIVPVKENANKFFQPDALHKNDHKTPLDIKCWPENQSNCRYSPFIVNYHTEIQRRRTTKKKQVEQTRIKRDRGNKSEKRDGFESSKSCCIEYSDIYTKAENPRIKLRKSEPTRTILLRNEFVETDNNNIAQAVNQSTQSKLLAANENKTESTLHQIKSILQSVLQEVKTNSNVNTVTEILKKDAIIQKGSSQNNMPDNSTLLHRYTYNNSCNTNPFLPPCSRQMSPGHYCFPSMPYQPVKCLQNFPVFVHPATGRPMCACYYRQSSHKSSHNKQATASTNTDRDLQKSSSNETEKLIKEIYKSMALNMDYPTKENSLSDANELKSTELNSITISNKEEKSTEAEILKKSDIEIEAMTSPLLSNTNENKFVYTAASSQSEYNRFTSDLSSGYTPERNNYFERSNIKGVEIQSTDTIAEAEEDTDETSDETVSDETIVLDESKQNKNEKKGLFKRMFNSVKLFKKRKESKKRKSESEKEQSSDSDSDVYQTLYSGRTVQATPKEKLRPHRRQQYSKVKIMIDQRNNRKVKRSPYLEQEYRRQWNENLMFHDQRERYSSERPLSRPTTSQPSAQPIYGRNYEARRTSVKQNVPSDLMMHQIINREIGNGMSSPKDIGANENAKGKLAWIKKHNPGIHCGKRWKEFILEN